MEVRHICQNNCRQNRPLKTKHNHCVLEENTISVSLEQKFDKIIVLLLCLLKCSRRLLGSANKNNLSHSQKISIIFLGSHLKIRNIYNLNATYN